MNHSSFDFFFSIAPVYSILLILLSDFFLIYSLQNTFAFAIILLWNVHFFWYWLILLIWYLMHYVCLVLWQLYFVVLPWLITLGLICLHRLRFVKFFFFVCSLNDWFVCFSKKWFCSKCLRTCLLWSHHFVILWRSFTWDWLCLLLKQPQIQTGDSLF